MNVNSETLDKKDVPGEDIVSNRDLKKNLARNTLSQIILFVFSAISSLYFVKYQMDNLGVANYGMVTLAVQVVAWSDVVALAVVGTISRFVTMHVAQGDWKQARSYFNTQFIAVTGFSLLLLPIAALVSYLTPVFFNIPAGQAANTKLLFFLTYLIFIFTIFSSTFLLGTYIKQRLDIRNFLEMGNQIMGYMVWIFMFSVFTPSIWHIGFGRLLGAGVLLTGTIITFRRYLPKLTPSLREFDYNKFKETIKMGIWMTVGRAGGMLYISFDAIIINKMLGPATVGRYAVVVGLAAMLRVFTGMVWNIIGPPAIAYATREDWVGLLRMSTIAVKFMSLGMAILLGIICGLFQPFIHLWLGPEFVSLTFFAWIMLSHRVLNQGMEPLFSINYALNKMAIPGTVTIAGGVFKVILAIVLVKYTRLGLYGIAIADIAAVSAKNLIFMPIYSGHIIKAPCWPLYKATLPSILVFAITAGIALVLSNAYNLVVLPRLIIVGIALAIVSCLMTYYVFLNKDDKLLLSQVAPWKKKR